MSDDPSGLRPRPKHWPYQAGMPRRYGHRYEAYQRRGGLVRIEEDVQGYVAGKPTTGDIGRFYFFCLAFDQLMKEGIRGDLAELGVYRGHTATLLARMARRMGTTAWLLDTFEGFSAQDLHGIDASRGPQFGDTSLEAVRGLVGEESVRYVKGFFPDTARELPEQQRYALVHIDCDLYDPIAHALAYFYPRMAPGGYLIVHDYASLEWDGAERAVDEFFADKPESPIPLTDVSGSVVIRKARERGQRNWLLESRRAALADTWVRAAGNALRPVLMAGWSGPEPWGVWGIGPSHEIDLYLYEAPREAVVLEADVAAALLPQRPTQSIAVHAGGRELATWSFTAGQNRGVRQVVVPAEAVAVGRWNAPVIQLAFRPQSVVAMNQLDPANADHRALGMGLYGLRRAAG